MKTNIPPRPDPRDSELVMAAVREALSCYPFSEEQLALIRDCYIREYFEVSQRGYRLLRFLERYHPDCFDFDSLEDRDVDNFARIGTILFMRHREAEKRWVADNGIRPQLQAGCRVRLSDGLEEISGTILSDAGKDGYHGFYWVQTDRQGSAPRIVRYEDRSLKPETADTEAE